MPNCFQLTRKGETEPIGLNTLDAELCKMLDVECHPKYWVAGWYNSIGLAVACGSTLEEQQKYYESDELYKEFGRDEKTVDYVEVMRKISKYLNENFVSSAWVER